MKRVAVVDIGSNSTRLLIADVEGEGGAEGTSRVTQELVRRTSITRLGAGVDANGRLSGDAIERVDKTLDEYRDLIDRQDVDNAIAVLTSAVRDASNGQEFAHTVNARYGLTPYILPGEEEARLTFLGATSERDPDDRTPTVVIDIGGGSTEFVIGVGREATFHVSTQAGVVRQTERHLHTDPPTHEEIVELETEVAGIIEAAVPSERRIAVEHAIAVAGTATSLAAIAQELDPYDPARVHGYRLTRQECERILQRLAALPLDQRRQVKGLHPDRAPTIVAGVGILLASLELFDLHELEVSEHDILRGAAIALAANAG